MGTWDVAGGLGWHPLSPIFFPVCLVQNIVFFFFPPFSSSKVKVGTNCIFCCGHSQVERYHLFLFVVTGTGFLRVCCVCCGETGDSV